MNGNDLLLKMENISPLYIAEAEDTANASGKKNAHRFKRFCAAAAAVCLTVTGGFALYEMMKQPKTDVLYPSVGIDFAELAEMGDSVGVILYCGIPYIECDYRAPRQEGDGQQAMLGDIGSIVGEYIGKTVSGVEAGANEENYVELASNMSGDVYTLRGYDPRTEEEPRRFICVVDGAGGVRICIQETEGYKIGSELFYDVLRLDEGFMFAEYQVYADFQSEKAIYYKMTDEKTAAAEKFISELGDKEFMKTWDIPHEGENSPYDKALGVLTLMKETGFEIELTLFEGGYVTYRGSSGGAVCVGEAAVDALLSAFGAE